MRFKPYDIWALTTKKKINLNNASNILDELLANKEKRAMEENTEGDKNKEKGKQQEENEEESMPVPQVRLGSDGEIIIYNQSLVSRKFCSSGLMKFPLDLI